MESYSVMAVLSAADKNFTNTMKSADKTLSSLETSAGKTKSSILQIGGTAAVFKAIDMATNSLVNSLDGAIKRYDTMNRFPKVMEQIGFSTQSSEKSVKKLADGIEGLPTSLDAITGSTQKIALLTGNLGKATDTSIALNNAFLASGSATADAERGLIQYTQMLSKGTVDMQSWRTLQETMGVGLNELAKAFGFAGETAQQDLYGALQSGTITFDQLNSKLIELDGGVNGFAERARTASAGIGTSFQNLQTATVKGVTKVIEATDQMLDDNGFPKLAEMIDNAKYGINDASSAIAGSIKTVGGAVITLGPSLAIGTAGWAAYGASMKISKKIDKARTSIEASRKAVEQARSATELSAKAELIAVNAAQARDKATRMAAISETLDTKAKAASVAASKAKASADKLAKRAAEARNAAAKAGWKNSALNAKAEATEAAATTAGAKADNLQAIAETKKAKAKSYSIKTSIAATTSEATSTAATTASTVATTAESTALTVKQAILGGLSAKLGIATTAQMAWNAALTANPIGTVVVAVAALVAVMAGVIGVINKLDTKSKGMMDTQQKAIDRSKEFVSSLKDTQKSYKDAASDADASAKANKNLADNIETLSAKENKSAQEKAELKAYVDSLNASMEGLNLQYSSEKDALNMSTDAMKERVKAFEDEAKAQAAQERYLEVKKEQIKLDEEQSVLQEKKNKFEKEWQQLNNDGPLAMSKYSDSMSEFNEQQTALNDKKQELSRSEEHLKGIMVESQQAQANAVASGAQTQITSLEQLNETQRAVVDSLNSSWQSYAEQATNMFDVLSDKSELSVGEMTANMQENQRVIGSWADNIAILAQKGVDEGLLEKLRQAGPESAGYVNAMVQASDTELQQMSEVFRTGGETATKALGAAIGSAEIPDEIMGFATKTKDTLAQQITSADFGSIGKNVVDGFTQGMGAANEGATTAGQNMGEAVKSGAAETLGIHSPSTVFSEYGANTIQGYVLGVTGSQGMLNVAMQSVMSSAGQVAVAAMSSSLKSMESVSTVAFAGIPSSARNGMSATTSIIRSGMAANNSAVMSGMNKVRQATEKGMKAMRTSTQSNMRMIQTISASGMAQFVRVIDSGMKSSVNSVNSGGRRMVSSVSSLRSDFYNSGFNASLGLASGINAGSGAAIAAAQSVANRVASIMRSALKEHSPSRVTREIGAFASEGLGLGILDNLKMVERSSLKVAEAVLPVGTIAGKVASPNFRNQYHNNREYAGDINNATYTIIVPVELEGREVARVTAPFTEDELKSLQRKKQRLNGIR